MKTLLVTLIVVYLCTSSAPAAELTIEECLEFALRTNLQIKSSEMAVVESDEVHSSAAKSFLPTLLLDANFYLRNEPDRLVFAPNTFAPGQPPRSVEQPFGSSTMYGMSLALEQPVFTGWKLTHAYSKTVYLNKEDHHRLDRGRKVLTSQVKKAAHETLKEQLLKEIQQHLSSAKRERLRVLNEQHREGYRLTEEILMLEADIATLDLEIYKAENRRAMAVSKLKKLMGTAPAEELVLKAVPMNGTLSASLPEIRQAARENREDLMASRMALNALDEEVGIAKSGYLPTVALRGTYTRQKETNITLPQYWMLMARLDWTLFDWGKIKSEVQRASAQVQRRRYDHQELEQEVLLEAEEAWRGVKEREMEITIREVRVKTAEFRVSTVIEKFAEGVAQLVDVTENESELLKTYKEYIAAVENLAISLASLEASTSVPIDRWFARKPLYQPNLTSYTARVEKIISIRKGRPPRQQPEDAKPQ